MQKSFRMRAVMHAAAIAGSCMAISAASAQNKNVAQVGDPDVRGAYIPPPRGEPEINCTIDPGSCQLFEYPRVAGTSQQASTSPIADHFKTGGTGSVFS